MPCALECGLKYYRSFGVIEVILYYAISFYGALNPIGTNLGSGYHQDWTLQCAMDRVNIFVVRPLAHVKSFLEASTWKMGKGLRAVFFWLYDSLGTRNRMISEGYKMKRECCLANEIEITYGEAEGFSTCLSFVPCWILFGVPLIVHSLKLQESSLPNECRVGCISSLQANHSVFNTRGILIKFERPQSNIASKKK